MKKIAILSDIHGNILALEKIVADLQSRQVEAVYNLGDHLSGPLWPQETADYLMAQGWLHVLGNHDRNLATQAPEQHGPSDRYAFQHLNRVHLDWLKSLPASLEIRKEFLLFHAAPASDTTYLLETVEAGHVRPATQDEIAARLGGTRFPILLCGHTHLARVVAMPEGALIVNPGSVGLPAYNDDTPEYHVVESGSPHARYALLEQKEGHWQCELIAIPYDHPRAASQACKNGRPDWEMGLQTGFMPARKAD